MTHSVCVVCGHKPDYGPTILCSESHCADIARVMGAEIGPLELGGLGESGGGSLSQDMVEECIRSALQLSHGESLHGSFFKTEWAQWEHFSTAVAIGYFETFENPPRKHWTSGRNIEVRRVRRRGDGDARGPFDTVVVTDPLAGNGEREIEQYTACQAEWENPNVFVLEGPFRYLQQWIAWNALPERKEGFPEDLAPMSFEGEFYEIVNTQQHRRAKGQSAQGGFLSCIDYGGLKDTYSYGWQDALEEARKDSKFTKNAILSGLRDEELWPALFTDFGGWMCVRPDTWVLDLGSVV